MTAGRRVAVVTDSAASLPPDAAERLGVTVVPMSLVLGDEVYADGALPPAEVVRRADGEAVHTSAPSPGDYLKAVESLDAEGVLITTVSQNMSASYEAAVAAAGYLPRDTTAVLDSRTAAGAQGLVVTAAALAAGAGRSLPDVGAAARRVVSRVRLVAAVEGLDHLARSGRVPGIAAWAGRSLGMRPMFEFAGGRVRARRPVLSQEAAVERIVSACRRSAREGARLRAAVLDAQAPEGAAALHDRIAAMAPGAEVYSAPFSSVMVAHTGPGLVGLAWWWEDGA